MLLDDLGVPLTVTADVIKLKIYDTEDRRNAPILASATCTIVTAAAGYVTAAFTALEFAIDPKMDGTPYFAFVERNENTGNTFEYSRKAHRIAIK